MAAARVLLRRSTAIESPVRSLHRLSPADVRDSSLPWDHMFSWRSLEEFVDRLHSSICYQDDAIVAIQKPWGVGIHRAHPTLKKQQMHMVSYLSFGDPRFSLQDGLPFLAERLHSPPLTPVRPIDRFESGLVLLAKGDKGIHVINKSINRCKPQGIPYAKFWCITKGYPVIPGSLVSEKITVMKKDADELAEYKEPMLIDKRAFRSSFIRQHQQDFVTGAVEMRVLASNHKLAVSLLQIATNQTKFSLVRCYAASKTSFILGDTRFAPRIRHIFGEPITLKPSAVSSKDYEPLAFPVRKRLLVTSNSHLPLMLHLHSFSIPGYQGNKDFEIVARDLPPHFEWTLNRLALETPVTSK